MASPRDQTASARRLAREDWVAFARTALIDSGIDNVKVDRLAKRAKVTRGSFYWHFKDRDDLLRALLRDWEVRNHIEVAEVRERWTEQEPNLAAVFQVWLSEDRNFLDFDFAIRGWARRSPEVADVVRRVDAAWIGLLEIVFRSKSCNGDDCLVRARITYFHQIGYHALAFKEDPAERLRLAPYYYRALTGEEPGEELDDVLDLLRRPTKRKRIADKAA